MTTTLPTDNAIPLHDDPIILFQQWVRDAETAEINDPCAASLASVDPHGQPSVRMVLCRGYDSKGFTFFTNFESRKGQQLLANPKAALCFHWKSLRRQVRIEGIAHVVSNEEADNYFQQRPRDSRIGAWASLQSQSLAHKNILLDRVRDYEQKFSGLENPPRPPHWSGFRIVPEMIEFWQDGAFRLHDRLQYTRHDNLWKKDALYP